MEAISAQEMDIRIAEITLVHRNRFVRSFRYSDYRGGRRSDGLVFCVSGVGVFDFGNETVTLNPGEMMFLSADSAYCVRNEGDAPFVHYTVNFKIFDYYPREGTVFSEILSGKMRYKTPPDEGGRFLPRLEETLSAWQTKHSGYLIMARASVYALLWEYLTGAGRSLRDRSAYARISAAKRLLDESFTEEHGTAELAGLCGMSETHFRRLWRREFGITPVEYHRRKRLSRAKDLLLSGLYSVSDAAHTVGYADANYFSRVFRAENGMSPREYMDAMTSIVTVPFKYQ